MAAAVVVMHAPVLLGGQTWADSGYLQSVVPSRLAAADAIAAGRLPTWWDGTGLGVPLAPAPHHGALYPPSWLPALAGGAAWALDLVIVLHVFWAALGVALWSRRLGADDLGAVAAGGAFAASGVIAAGIPTGAVLAVAHLPWIGWAADRVGMAADGGGRARAAVVLAALLGLVGLSGELAIGAEAIALAVAAAAARSRHRGAAVGCAVGAVVAGALLAAVQLWPALLHLTGDVAGAAPAEPPRWLGVVIPGAGAPFVGLPAVALAAGIVVTVRRRR